MDGVDDLFTIRDLVRHAVSRFNAAGIAYGHGTTSAIDEAAFLVLEALHLPVDDLAPWLDARLTRAERTQVLDLIERRITERLPAPYLLGRAYIQGVPFRVDARTIVPRSFIGELMTREDLFGPDGALVQDCDAVERVLDLCTGGGSLAILAARLFPNALIDAVDVSTDALDLARANVADHDLVDRISLHAGDLFAPLGEQRYDLILTNPPYVDAEGMAALPPEARHEPTLALDGGADGLDIVRRILAAAPKHLMPTGGLICEVGRGRDNVIAAWPDMPFLWLDTEDSEGEVFWLAAADLGTPPRRRGATSRRS